MWSTGENKTLKLKRSLDLMGTIDNVYFVYVIIHGNVVIIIQLLVSIVRKLFSRLSRVDSNLVFPYIFLGLAVLMGADIAQNL